MQTIKQYTEKYLNYEFTLSIEIYSIQPITGITRRRGLDGTKSSGQPR